MNESVTELANIWGLALSNIEKELNNKIVFDSFFTDTKIAKAEGNIMTIVASSSLAVSMFKNQFLKTIKSAVNKATGTEYVLEFKTKEEFESSKPSEDEAPHFFPKARLDPRFSFDNFVVGSSDIEARQAAVLIASNPGKTFNPLLIYGDSGLGKTHLLEAIGNEIREPNTWRAITRTKASSPISATKSTSCCSMTSNTSKAKPRRWECSSMPSRL